MAPSGFCCSAAAVALIEPGLMSDLIGCEPAWPGAAVSRYLLARADFPAQWRMRGGRRRSALNDTAGRSGSKKGLTRLEQQMHRLPGHAETERSRARRAVFAATVRQSRQAPVRCVGDACLADTGRVAVHHRLQCPLSVMSIPTSGSAEVYAEDMVRGGCGLEWPAPGPSHGDPRRRPASMSCVRSAYPRYDRRQPVDATASIWQCLCRVRSVCRKGPVELILEHLARQCERTRCRHPVRLEGRVAVCVQRRPGRSVRCSPKPRELPAAGGACPSGGARPRAGYGRDLRGQHPIRPMSPPSAYALAFDAGAYLIDMEFVQFGPTVACHPPGGCADSRCRRRCSATAGRN